MSRNEYDTMLEPGNEYDKIVAGQMQDQNVALRRSMLQASDATPDRQAEVLRLSQRTKLPADIVDRNLDTIKKNVEFQSTDYDRILRDTPNLGQWLQDPHNAAVAKDDLGSLGAIEDVGRSFVAGVPALVGSVTSGAGDLLDVLSRGLYHVVTGRSAQGQGPISTALQEAGKAWKDIGELWIAPPAERQTLPSEIAGAVGQLAGQVTEAIFAPEAVLPSLMAQGADTLGEMTRRSFEQILSGAPQGEFSGMVQRGNIDLAHRPHVSNPDGSVSTVRSMSFEEDGKEVLIPTVSPDGKLLSDEQAIELYRRTGQFLGKFDSPEHADQYAQALHKAQERMIAGAPSQTGSDLAELGGAAVMGLVGKFGLEKLLERVPPQIQNGILRRLADVTIAGGYQAGLQVVQDTLNNVITRLTINPDQRVIGDLSHQAIIGGATGAIARAVLGVAVPDIANKLDKADQAKVDSHRMSVLGALVRDSKTFQRLPESVRDFISKVNSDGNVYVPIEKWRTFWQEKGQDPAAVLAEATGSDKQYVENTGQDLAIPIADYATKIASSPELDAAFAPEIRLAPDGMNAREAAAIEQAIQENAKQAQLTPEENRNAESAARVREDIVGQIVNQGFDRTAVESYAKMYESVFGALGERAGFDPFQRFIQYNLRINRPLPDVLRSQGNIDAMDALLDRLRNNQVPTQEDMFGPSLVDFLRSKGGVVDEGGDLASREVDAENKPFQRNLIQPETGLPLDRAREAAAEAGYLDHQTSIADFLDKLEEEFRGKPVFSPANENPQHVEMATVLNQLDSYLKSRDIELKNMSNEDIKKILAEAVTMPRSGGGVEFAQEFNSEKRGSIRFGSNREFNIDLLKTANLSTFLHESGHFFLEVFNDAADQLKTVETQNETQRRMLQDQATLLKWMGVESRDQIGTEQHEQFARGIEQYLMEGKAPSVELRSAFARFRAWLVSIYKSLTSLNVQLTPEVREVMDRLFATDRQIETAERDAEVTPLLTDAATYGMSETEFAAYKDLVQRASDESRDTLQQKLMDQYQRARKEWWQKERDKTRQEVADEVHKQPQYQALSILQKGKMPDGSELPEDVQPIKLDLNEIDRRYGKSSKKVEDGQRLGSTITNKLVDLRVVRREGGVSLEVAAELLGFRSGDDLIQAVVNARPMNELIDAETDDRMRQTHGDMLTDGSLADQARAAVMGDGHTKVIEAEVKALNKKRREVQPFVAAAKRALSDEQRSGLETLDRVPSVNAVRQFARTRVAQMQIRDIQPDKFFRAARVAAREAIEQAGKQNFDKALAAKLRHLTNSELYRAAVDAKEDLESIKDQFQKMFKPDAPMAKSRNMDYVNAARAIAAQYMFPDKKFNVLDALDKVQKYDPDLYDVLKDQIQSAMGDGKTLRDLTYEQFVGIKDTAMGLWEMSRRSQQVKIEDRLLSQADVVGELKSRLDEFSKPNARAGYDRAMTNWEKTKMYLLGARAALRRVESWADAMDGGDPAGVFRKYIWNPISEGAAAYRLSREDYIRQYLDIVKGVEKSITTDPIRAPELGYTFGGKQELLHALLHTGNDSNLQKLLRGRSWGDFDQYGNLDTTRWDDFVRRAIREKVLTKADFDYAQSVWNLLETLKPQAQKAHREMYGYYFSEVTAREFSNEFGTYKGGYVPAIVDPFIASDAAVRSEKEALGSDNAFMFPTTGRGFTKSRVEAYAKPLALDLRYIPSHIDKVLRFINLEPRVKDVGRLVWDRGLRQALDDHDKTVVSDMLVPWLQRAATQRIQQSSKGWGGKAVDKFFSTLRTRVGLQMMAANVTNTLTQLHGVTLAAVKVKPTSLMSAMWEYVRSPLETAKTVNEKSDFMRTRVSSQQMEIQKTIDDILLNPSLFEKGRDLIRKHGYFMQHALHDVSSRVAWLGAYNEAVEGGAPELDAVKQADAVVRQTQGSHAPEDVARFEATIPFIRAFNMFSSFFNMQANLLGTEFSKIATNDMGLRKGAGRALYVYTFGLMAPAVLYDGLRIAMAGGIDHQEDESYLKEIMEIFFASQLKSTTAMVPLVGPIANAAVGKFTKGSGDDDIRVSPAVTSIESAAHAPGDVYKALSEKELTGTEIKDVMTLVGLLSGIPTGPIANAARYVNDVKRQKVQKPKNALDAARGVLSGQGPVLTQ